MPEITQNSSKYVEMFTSWFFRKDRSAIFADDTFIELPSISTPGTPTNNRRRTYGVNDSPVGSGMVALDDSGREDQYTGDVAAWQKAISTYLALPGLRGFWPMSSVGDSGAAMDLSGQGRTLTNTNTVLYGYDNLAPYAQFLAASSNYLSRATEAGFDIIGNEAYIENPGLTMGLWAKETTAVTTTLMGKVSFAPISLSYRIRMSGTSISGRISNTGAAEVSSGDGTAALNVWHLLILEFIPSTSVSIYIDGALGAQNVAAIPATIFNSTAAFQIGDGNFTGESSCGFLCVSALSSAQRSNLYQQTRSLFGV